MLALMFPVWVLFSAGMISEFINNPVIVMQDPVRVLMCEKNGDSGCHCVVEAPQSHELIVLKTGDVCSGSGDVSVWYIPGHVREAAIDVNRDAVVWIQVYLNAFVVFVWSTYLMLTLLTWQIILSRMMLIIEECEAGQKKLVFDDSIFEVPQKIKTCDLV